MKSFIHWAVAFCIVCANFSCSKPLPVTPNQAMIGNWQFTSLDVQLHSTVAGEWTGIFFKVDTIFNYKTSDTRGDLQVTRNMLITSNVSYSVSGTLYFNEYSDDSLTYAGKIPTHFTNTYETLTEYILVNGDSLFFPNGLVVFHPDTTGVPYARLSGAKVALNANTMTLTSVLDQTDPYPWEVGDVYTIKATVVATYQKK